MRQDPEFFGDQELILVFVAKRLKEALALEKVFDADALDYVVVPESFTSGVLFRSERVGAFFYVTPEHVPRARELMRGQGYTPFKEERRPGGAE